jgi:ABC-type polysaccharide/polyol phosphate transport system ATPase subunit
VNLVELTSVRKSFLIPSVHRDSVREHFFGLFRPRRFERLEVLRDVSFQVRRGETFGIMGRNGEGKSTLLKILSGIYEPDAGRVDIRAPITPILELGTGWSPELDAVDNVLLIGTIMGLSLREARRVIDPILAFAGLERFANVEVKHFSSGMAERLSYSVAFHAVREVLIIDEVFAVGDAGFKAKCEQRFKELRAKGTTVIVVSHAAEAVGRLCDRAIVLERGGVAFEGTGKDVAQHYVQRTQERGPNVSVGEGH